VTFCTEIRSPTECQKLCEDFAAYFVNKIRNIKTTTRSRLRSLVVDPLQSDPAYCGPLLTTLTQPTADEVRKLISSMSAKSSPIDSIPTPIRKCISDDDAKTIAATMVSTRLDYCNSVLYNTSHCNISKLQPVHNTLARAVTCTRKRNHITPILADLHWLPIAARIDYKVVLLTFKTLTTKQPSYLHELLQAHRPARLLRSNEHINRLHDNGAWTSFATRAFSHAAPTIWNSLPQELTNQLSSLSVFKRNLKTFLYSRSFSQ